MLSTGEGTDLGLASEARARSLLGGGIGVLEVICMVPVMEATVGTLLDDGAEHGTEADVIGMKTDGGETLEILRGQC